MHPERPDVRARALADPVGFFRENQGSVILDEIQHAPQLLHFVKDLIDEDRVPGRWLMTGSQNFSLMRGVSQTLAGRIAVLTLEPLSTEELHGSPSTRSLSDILGRVFGVVAKPSPERHARVKRVNLVIEHGGRLYGLEVKAIATPTPYHAEGLVQWRDLAGRSAHVALACRVEEPTVLRPGIRAVPWHLGWL